MTGRWLSKDVVSMSLGEIQAEISAIESKSIRDRTVLDAERLKDLRDAKRRISGRRRG